MIAESVLDILEYKKILGFIARYAMTSTGKNKVLSTLPFHEQSECEIAGMQVSQAKEILIRAEDPPLESLPDIREDISLSRIEGALLSGKKILQIHQLAVISRNCFSFFKSHSEISPLLWEKTKYLFIDKVFEHHITRILNENGEVKDNASKELMRIRDEIREKNNDLHKLVTRIIKNLSDLDIVREDYLTLRDGRIVVPVKVEHKRQIKGFIHSESATGQTVYIEPEETLHLNNEIVTLSFAEKREIDRLLRELTKKIGEVSDSLSTNLEIITEVDLIFSKARYAIETIAEFPTINNTKPFSIHAARHPYLLHKLGREKCVPLDANIEQENVILITGPNAGGKTVVLKTLGLLSAMVLSGIPIPASPDSNFHFFEKILLDIGDKQSIEDDLSTFSSHLSNINNILNQADESSLVLLDELGTGTDPSAGAALGASVLITLRNKKAMVLATTHYGRLKLLANEVQGIYNAAMEFNTVDLCPTYRFKQGIPGSSYAFEIVKRLGFNSSFIDTAMTFLDKNEQELDRFLLEIEKKDQELHQRLKKLEVENSRLKGLSALYDEKIRKLEKEKNDILRKTKEEGRELLVHSKKELEKLVKEVKESNASHESIKSAQALLSSLRDNVEKIKLIEEERSVRKEHFDIGASVRIKNSNTVGKIIEANNEKGVYIVHTGVLKMKVKSNELEVISGKAKKELESLPPSISVNEVKFRIDIRGEKPEMIEHDVIKFIDDAYSTGLDRVEILHGKGTGVLKKMVRDILRSHLGVKTFYFAPVEFGGEGITIVEFKK